MNQLTLNPNKQTILNGSVMELSNGIRILFEKAVTSIDLNPTITVVPIKDPLGDVTLYVLSTGRKNLNMSNEFVVLIPSTFLHRFEDKKVTESRTGFRFLINEILDHPWVNAIGSDFGKRGNWGLIEPDGSYAASYATTDCGMHFVTNVKCISESNGSVQFSLTDVDIRGMRVKRASSIVPISKFVTYVKDSFQKAVADREKIKIDNRKKEPEKIVQEVLTGISCKEGSGSAATIKIIADGKTYEIYVIGSGKVNSNSLQTCWVLLPLDYMKRFYCNERAFFYDMIDASEKEDPREFLTQTGNCHAPLYETECGKGIHFQSVVGTFDFEFLVSCIDTIARRSVFRFKNIDIRKYRVTSILSSFDFAHFVAALEGALVEVEEKLEKHRRQTYNMQIISTDFVNVK